MVKRQVKRKTARAPRSYYTISQDSLILEKLRKVSKSYTKSQASKDLASQLNRSMESIRDRIKRYLAKLSVSDQKLILNNRRKNGNHYVHWNQRVGANGSRSILKLSVNRPATVPSRTKKVTKARKTRKVATKPKTQDDFEWLARKLQSQDPYFACDNGVQFLNCLFAELVQNQNVSQTKIDKYVRGVDGEVSLRDVLSHFGVN